MKKSAVVSDPNYTSGNCVFVLWAKNTDKYTIGHSVNVGRHLKMRQKDCPIELEVICCCLAPEQAFLDLCSHMDVEPWAWFNLHPGLIPRLFKEFEKIIENNIHLYDQ